MTIVTDNPKINGLTQRQENFVLEYVRTGEPVKAYKASYKAGGKPATIQHAVNKLLRHADIKRRIAEVRETMRERMEITVADVVKELWRNSGDAQAKGAIPASNQALIAIGNHLGMFEPKPQTEQQGIVQQLTPEERRALRAALEQERERRAALAARPADAVGPGDQRTLN